MGIVLGSLLFLIYANDMPEVVSSATKVFTNDTKLHSNNKRMSRKIAHVFEPEQSNNMKRGDSEAHSCTILPSGHFDVNEFFFWH